MARLETVGWVESSWEDPEQSIRDGRPRRRYYQLTRDGAEQSRLALAEISASSGKAPGDPDAPRPGPLGARAVNEPPPVRPAGRRTGDPSAGLCEVLQTTRPDADTGLIGRAYDVAAAWHQGQARMSGDLVYHPPAGRGDDPGRGRRGRPGGVRRAAARHRSTTRRYDRRSEPEFGPEIADLVAGVAALDHDQAPGRRSDGPGDGHPSRAASTSPRDQSWRTGCTTCAPWTPTARKRLRRAGKHWKSSPRREPAPHGRRSRQSWKRWLRPR